MKGQHGGARAGAGRTKGSITRRLQMIRDMSEAAIKRAKKVPLEAMLKNMERFDEEADDIYAELKRLRAVNINKLTKAQRSEHIDLMRFVWNAFRECTLDTQKCAVDAAPFVHQKLAMLTVKPEENSQVNRIREETAMSDDELSAYYQQLRMRPTTVEPMVVTIDNNTGELVPNEED